MNTSTTTYYLLAILFATLSGLEIELTTTATCPTRVVSAWLLTIGGTWVYHEEVNVLRHGDTCWYAWKKFQLWIQQQAVSRGTLDLEPHLPLVHETVPGITQKKIDRLSGSVMFYANAEGADIRNAKMHRPEDMSFVLFGLSIRLCKWSYWTLPPPTPPSDAINNANSPSNGAVKALLLMEIDMQRKRGREEGESGKLVSKKKR
ncbi:Protein of unknown function [Pyronema omphalodes CBS 100304]|uniref:Uncharacterized protein n=1 Tax=Pyronema omphalodes (strain CBS 100304) TaxID=1076935 RepID=U4LEI0_PYROM|nr:Protein of unknown function [Pyronema omphalodes CBS 100304]